LTTHRISPDVDESREFVVADLLASQVVEKVGWVSGVGRAPRTRSRASNGFRRACR